MISDLKLPGGPRIDEILVVDPLNSFILPSHMKCIYLLDLHRYKYDVEYVTLLLYWYTKMVNVVIVQDYKCY